MGFSTIIKLSKIARRFSIEYRRPCEPFHSALVFVDDLPFRKMFIRRIFYDSQSDSPWFQS